MVTDRPKSDRTTVSCWRHVNAVGLEDVARVGASGLSGERVLAVVGPFDDSAF